MYTRCLFCAGNLGRNEAVEAFPVGRRLAFDAAKGRLWVVCVRCARWNLTPLEERWEAIEQAERGYRGSRLHVSTDNVGLARLRDGTELVRIGRPLRPELAAWRYGHALRRRRIAHYGRLAAATSVRGALLGLTFWLNPFYVLAQAAGTLYDAAAGTGDAPSDAEPAYGARVPVRIGSQHIALNFSAADVDVLPRDDGDVAVEVPWGRGRRVLDGISGQRVLDALMLRMNAAGATAETLDGAVERLVRAGSAEAYLRLTAERTVRARHTPRRRAPGSPGTGLYAVPPEDRLTLEMALHEARERRAMDGELAELERVAGRRGDRRDRRRTRASVARGAGVRPVARARGPNARLKPDPGPGILRGPRTAHK